MECRNFHEEMHLLDVRLVWQPLDKSWLFVTARGGKNHIENISMISGKKSNDFVMAVSGD